MFAEAGHSWTGLGVNWRAALDELEIGPYPAMFLTINERAHHLICDPATDHACAPGESSHGPVDYERELARQAIAEKLTADWRTYLANLARSGRVRTVS